MAARAVYREFSIYKNMVKRCVFGFLDFCSHFRFLLIYLGVLGVVPLDAARNSTRFGATNASRALTAVQFRLATVSLLVLGTWYQVLGTWYQVPSTSYLVPSTWYLVPST